MSQQQIRNERIANLIGEISKYLLIALLYLVIYSITFSNVLIISLFVLAACEFFLSDHTYDWKHLLIAVSLFVVPGLSLVYSSSPTNGVSILETRLPILILPFVVMVAKPDTSLRRLLFRHYILSLVLSFFVLIAIAIYRNILGPGPEGWFNKWYYHYSDLTEPIRMDPLYLGAFVGFGILALLVDQFESKDQQKFLDKRISILAICVLCIFLALIGVRSIILITLALTIFLVFRNLAFFSDRNMKLKAFAVVLIITGASLLSPVTRERFEGLYSNKFQFSTLTMDRLVIWSVATKHIISNPTTYLFGNGIGTSEQVMSNLYQEANINWDFEKKTNTHNQYIEFTMDAGFIGGLFLILFLGWSWATFKARRDSLAAIFVIFIALAMVVENYLNRQKGVVFVGLFYSLFFFSEKPTKGSKL